MISERLEKLIEEMVNRGVHFEDAVREFEKRFITRVLGACDGSLTKTADGKPAPDWWVQWGTNFAEDFDTGFKASMWASDIEYNPEWPDSIFSNDTLVREPHQPNFWGK